MKMADPPRFEHGFKAPQAPVISRLHYGSNRTSKEGSSLIPTVIVREIYISSGRIVFQLGCANFLDFGPSLG